MQRCNAKIDFDTHIYNFNILTIFFNPDITWVEKDQIRNAVSQIDIHLLMNTHACVVWSWIAQIRLSDFLQPK